MGTQDDARQVAEARTQLSRYLSDEIAPMIFADSAEYLLKAPLEIVAQEIQGWIGIQLQGPNPSEICDYLLHSAKKIHHLGDLELIPIDELQPFLAKLGPILITICPEVDRAELTENLSRLDVSSNVIAAQIAVGRSPSHRGSGSGGGGGGGQRRHGGGEGDDGATGHRDPTGAVKQLGQVPSGGKPAGESARPSAQPARSDDPEAHIVRLNALLDRWENLAGRAATGGPPASGPTRTAASGGESALLSRIIDEVASSSKSSTDLDSKLAFLNDFGLSGLGSGVFKALSGALPDWAPSRAPTGTGEAKPPLSGPAETMRKLVDLAEDPVEIQNRFSELMATAVDEFNKGSLGRAVTVLDLAQRMVDEKEVSSTIAKGAIEQSARQLDETQLRAFADNEDKRLLLRRVLEFFPTLQVDELFQDLMTEERRDRRRLLLLLLTVHGEAARARSFEILNECVSGNNPQPWFVQRNLIYLMRSISPSESLDIDKEIDLLVRASVPGGELPLIRETLTALGQIDHPRAIQTLTARISDFEDVLAEKGNLVHNPTEVQSLLDTAIKALARFNTKEARQCVVTHGLKRRPELGDTYGRLAMLGTQDLSDDKATITRLLQALEGELPMKVFGLAVKTSRKNRNLENLIESLSGTDIPPVRRAYDSLVRRFSGEQFSDAAAKALTNLGSKKALTREAASDESAGTSLSGDLSLFGLPNLMQNLADSRVEGVLTVLDNDGNATASITLGDGMMIDATVGPLRGDVAVFQLLERPTTGRFIFVNQTVDATTERTDQPGKSVMSVLMEGMRRYDEFNRALTVVADDDVLQATGRQPTGLADENDADFVNSVWLLAAKGATSAAVEKDTVADSYRIRRLYEHWVNEGSLKFKDAADSSI